MALSKKYRYVSLEGCRLLGQGAHGKVYQLDEDTIIKVYYDKSPLKHIERERSYAQSAFLGGVPSAITYDVVTTEEGFGIVFELAGGMPLGSYIAAHPELAEEYGAKFADVMNTLNSTPADKTLFGSIKELYAGLVKNTAPYFRPKQIEALSRVVESLPEGDTLVHGDYHPQNVMVTKNGDLLLIDMADISYGSPFFDIAGSYLTLVYAPGISSRIGRRITGLDRKTCNALFRTLLAAHCGTDDPAVLDEYMQYCKKFSYLRMASNIAMDNNLVAIAKWLISLVVKWKILRHEDEYIRAFTAAGEAEKRRLAK